MGRERRRKVGPKTLKMCKCFHLPAFDGGSFNIHTTEVGSTVWLLIFAPPEAAAMLDCSLRTKSRKGLARDVRSTSATDTSHIHDVTDLVKMTKLTAVFS